MPTTNTNFTSLITAIDTKAQSLAASTTDPKDLVFLGKAVEALNVPDTVSAIIAEGDTQVTTVNTAGTTQVGNVNTAGTTQVAAIQAAGGSYATQANVDALISTIAVTAVTGAFIIDGTNKKALNLSPSVTYRFDVSDASNATHPLKFSTTADGTHASGTAFTTGVTAVGTQGTAGAYVQIIVEQDSVNLFYYCHAHSGMGNTAYSAYNVLSTAPSDGEVLSYSASQGAYINTAASSGGSAVEVADITLDTHSDNLNSFSKYLNSSNLNAYIQTVRIRGLDNATLAFGGANTMVHTGSTSGNMQHNFALLSANQTTGAIATVNCITTHNNTGSTADYSTFGKASDEWTGRYTYMGHVPRNGSSHTYGYDMVMIYGTSSQDSDHSNNSNYYPHGNYGSSSQYVAPSERRLGGAVNHFLEGYTASGGKATVMEYKYGYNATSLANTSAHTAGFSTSATSTQYRVHYFNQYDVTNEPYYDAFHSVTEGLYGRNRSNGNWGNLGSFTGMSADYTAWFLSNGNTIIENNGAMWLITSSGGISALPSTYAHPFMSIAYMNHYEFAWNVGTDEWIQALPQGQFLKFKFNPSTGQVTASNNKAVVPAIAEAAYGGNFHQKRGFWSAMNPTSIGGNGSMFTFGNENSTGHGYGKSKLFFIGGDGAYKTIVAATYDLVPVLNVLTYA
jgi:hypothetical protein